MAGRGPPDLKRLAVLVVRLVAPRSRGALTEDDAKRIECVADSALSLVLLRVGIGALVKAGLMTDAEYDGCVESARPVERPSVTALDVMTPRPPATSNVLTMRDVISRIDVMLTMPGKRDAFPRWFIEDLWPGLLRRLASGQGASEREQALLRNTLAEAELHETE